MLELIPVDAKELKAKWWLGCEYSNDHMPMLWEEGREALVLIPRCFHYKQDQPIGDFDVIIWPEDFNCLVVLWDCDNDTTQCIVVRNSIQALVADVCRDFEREYEPDWLPQVSLERRQAWKQEDLAERREAKAKALEWAAHLEAQAQELRRRAEQWTP